MMPVNAALRVVALLIISVIAGRALAAEPIAEPQKGSSDSVDARVAKRLKAERELEALLLQTLVSTAYTKKDSGLFGGGSAGRQWQAMMSEHVARAIAASGQVRLLPASRRQHAGRRSTNPRLTGFVPAATKGVSNWVTVTSPETSASQLRAASQNPQQ